MGPGSNTTAFKTLPIHFSRFLLSAVFEIWGGKKYGVPLEGHKGGIAAMISIRETTSRDLKDVQKLWADGDVMKFVGFPEGLHETDENMKKWLSWMEEGKSLRNHYSLFDDGVYCGESFYSIDADHDYSAALDIKLFSFARGKGIGTAGLKHAIKEAFANGAKTVWVDPDPQNVKAIALYQRLGFVVKEPPSYVAQQEEGYEAVYMELKP